jgi:hypothetical protein
MGSVTVELSSRTPEALRVWEEAHALGKALLGRHRDVERCTIAVHARRREGLRWQLGREAHLAVHWALTRHPDTVLDVLDGDEAAWSRLRTRLPVPAPPRPRPRGEVHALDVLLSREREHLPGTQEAPHVDVTWGRFGRKPRRGLRLGSCEASDPPLIRIHPVLDHETVPDWFVGFVLYHELLHVVFPPEDSEGRRLVHGRHFRRAEAAHPRYAQALAWEETHLPALLLRCRQR